MAKKPGDVGPAERQKLSTGPMDMPDRGGSNPNAQITSEQVKLSRNEHPVANLENRPGMGRVQINSERCDLQRKHVPLYGDMSQTQPGQKLPISPLGKKSSSKGSTKY